MRDDHLLCLRLQRQRPGLGDLPLNLVRPEDDVVEPQLSVAVDESGRELDVAREIGARSVPVGDALHVVHVEANADDPADDPDNASSLR